MLVLLSNDHSKILTLKKKFTFTTVHGYKYNEAKESALYSCP